jgi:hypothetical protein
MMGQQEVMAALDYYGGIATTHDVGGIIGDYRNASKYLSAAERAGKITSIESVVIGIKGARPKIWVRYYENESSY